MENLRAAVAVQEDTASGGRSSVAQQASPGPGFEGGLGSRYERSADDEGSHSEDGRDDQMSHSEDCTEREAPEVRLGGSLSELGSHFERCIQEVGQLQRRRDDLVQELLRLEQPMAREIAALRAEMAEALRQLLGVQLEQRRLREETLRVKRKLFVTTRDCIQSQVALATQQHDVAQFAITQEELRDQILQLSQEVSQLQEAQQKRLRASQARPPVRPRAHSDLTAGRRASLELQQYLRGRMSFLQEWYEPRLLALLRRRQAGEEALRRSREPFQDLRAQLGPLREHVQRLELQRSCLEETIALMELERKENVEQYRETLDTLEEALRRLRSELQVQRKRNKKLETMNSRLEQEAEAHRVRSGPIPVPPPTGASSRVSGGRSTGASRSSAGRTQPAEAEGPFCVAFENSCCRKRCSPLRDAEPIGCAECRRTEPFNWEEVNKVLFRLFGKLLEPISKHGPAFKIRCCSSRPCGAAPHPPSPSPFSAA